MLHLLPSINAMLNATSVVLLLLGIWCIMNKRKDSHIRFMIGAASVSVVFFISYLFYHYHVGSVKFMQTGWIRPVYFSILISHTILAIVIVPLVIRTLWLAVRKRFDSHKAIGRITFPIWLYVSISGVVVYWMLYQLT